MCFLQPCISTEQAVRRPFQAYQNSLPTFGLYRYIPILIYKMGSESIKPELNTPIVYQTVNHHTLTFQFQDLKGKHLFPSLPPEPLIQRLFNQTLKDIKATEQAKNKYKTMFSPKYKFRFVMKHKQLCKKIQEDLLKAKEHSANQKQLNNRQNDLLLAKFEQFRRSSNVYTLALIDDYVNNDKRAQQLLKLGGIQLFYQKLQEDQIKNRFNPHPNYKFKVELLKTIRKVQKFSPNFFQEVCQTIPKFLRQLVFCLHEVHLQLNICTYQIIGQFFWGSQVWCDQFLQSLGDFSQSLEYKTRFQIFITILLFSENIIMIQKTIEFINQFIESLPTPQRKRSIKAQLAASNYHSALEVIQQKINAQQFSISKCCFRQVHKTIQEHKRSRQMNLALKKTSSGTSQQTDSTPDISKESDIFLRETDIGTFKRYQTLTTQQIRAFFNPQSNEDKFQAPNVDAIFAKLKQYCSINNLLDNMIILLMRLQGFNRQQWIDIEKKLQVVPSNFTGTDRKLMLKIEVLEGQLRNRDQEIKMILEDNAKHMLAVKDLQKNKDRAQLLNTISNLKKQIDELKRKPLANHTLAPPINLSANNHSLLAPPPNPSNLLLSSSLGSKETAPSLLPPPGSLPTLAPPPNSNLSPPTSGLLPPPTIGLLPPSTGLLPPPSLSTLSPPKLQNGGSVLAPPAPLLPLIPQGRTEQIKAVPQKVKQKRKPKHPLKNVMWVTIPYRSIIGTIWQQLDDSKIKINPERLQTEFPKAQVKLLQTQAPRKQLISLFSPQRTKIYQLVMGKLKLSASVICQSLFTCDEKYLTVNNLQSLAAIIPTDAQTKTVKAFSGNPQDLQQPQFFVFSIIKVPLFADRINALRFARLQSQLFSDLDKKLKIFNRTFDFLSKSAQLKALLQYSLAVGNFLNGQGARGGAWGVKLQGIDKLGDIKAIDGKTTAGMLTVQLLGKAYRSPIFSNEQIQDVDFISKFPTSQLKGEVGQIRKGLKCLRRVIQNYSQQFKLDNFKRNYQGSMLNLIYKIDVANFQVEKVQERYVSVCSYFGEDSNQSSQVFGFKILRLMRFCRRMEDQLKKQQSSKPSSTKSASKFIDEIRRKAALQKN